jgi:hypothetical protein
MTAENQISISVPNSATCRVGTPKKAAERSALRCRNANAVSRHMPPGPLSAADNGHRQRYGSITSSARVSGALFAM